MLAISNAHAQPGPERGGGRGSTNSYVRLYNPSTVETVKGEVVRVEKFSPGKGLGALIHLTLQNWDQYHRFGAYRLVSIERLLLRLKTRKGPDTHTRDK
jgi:hypothetical protein